MARAQFCAFSSVVVSTESSTYSLEVGALEVAAQQVAGAELADAQLLGVRGCSSGAAARSFSRLTSNRVRSPAPHVDQRDEQQGDEDEDLDEHEDLSAPFRITPTGYRKTTSMSNRMNSIATM